MKKLKIKVKSKVKKAAVPRRTAKTVFSKKAAKKMADMSYYIAQQDYIKHYEFMEKEKTRLSTTDWPRLTQIIEEYRDFGTNAYECPAGKTLLGIFNKNKTAILEKRPRVNNNILSVVAKPEILLLAYREIRGNTGAMTPGASKSKQDIANMTTEQRELYFKSNIFPDGFSMYHVMLTSRLVRKGMYPWGTSSRIYIDKPGVKDKKRPLTIPPFMDRVVQKAIELVLQSIYEPEFEYLNRSFGFRPNKGVHDAITAIQSYKTNGMRTAIEGDIEAAYDTVDKEQLLEILGEKIKDVKFIQFMRKRLSYEYVEKESGRRIKPELGIPQGGIDSPYLFNIYMHQLDEFIDSEVTDYVYKLNEKKLGSPNPRARNTRKRVLNKHYSLTQSRINKLKKDSTFYKKKLRDITDRSNPDNQIKVIEFRKKLLNNIKNVRLERHRSNRITSIENTMREVRIFYLRYADDWILLTNGTKEMATHIKEMIATFLEKELKLRLSPNKTLITDITEGPAKFLGFQIRGTGRGPLSRKPIKGATDKSIMKYKLNRSSGLPVWTSPDHQRLLDRMHMKGLCSKKGFPKELPWLTTLEPNVILERYNSIIRGLANYYLGYIRNNSHLHYWLYVLRFSCLKTLAQKYRTSISGIFKKYGHNLYSKSSQTIAITVALTRGKKTYTKKWTLITYADMVKKTKETIRPKKLAARFWDAELRDVIGDYPLKAGKIAKVTNEDYLESISWVNLRTQASFDMPCALCGTLDDVEMHHIRHVRKTSYKLIPEELTYKQVMSLRNRKQIPVCFNCHRKTIHEGEHKDVKLSKLSPCRLADNRIVNIESYIQPGVEVHGKTLEQKGWKLEE